MHHSLTSDRQEDIHVWLQMAHLTQKRSIESITLKPARRLAALVTLDDGHAFFLKKMFESKWFEDLVSATSERDTLTFIQDSEDLYPYRQVMPAMHAYLEEESVLITEGLQEYISLKEFSDQRGCYDQRIIKQIAENLAACHMSSKQYKPSQDIGVYYSTAPIPTYGHITPVAYTRTSGRDYGKYLLEVQNINEELRKLRASWTQNSLIHGDFKFDNIMVCVQPDHEKRGDVKFIDWELSGWGDALWDVGSLIGSSLLQWILSIQIDPTKKLQYWVQHATTPFDTVRSLASCFISHYFLHTDAQDVQEQRQKIIFYVGVFLLHRALVGLETAGVLTTTAYCCMYIGKTLIAQPQLGLRLLFED